MSDTVFDLLDDYLLTHDLKEGTAGYYRRMIGVLCQWAKRRVPRSEFTPDLVNRLLLDKQRSGLSSHYRKSLRSGLRALLVHHQGGALTGKLRPVRVDDLEIEVWSAAEVQRLIDACLPIRDEHRRRWFQTIIAAGYFTGLSNCDLWALPRKAIDKTGIVRTKRAKTGKPIVARVPVAWLIELQLLRPLAEGLVWGRPMSREAFRRAIRKIVRRAGLKGSFKKLRKSCGTSIEMLYPGRGHIALGNTRAVFERHYFGRKRLDDDPMGPEGLPVK